MKKILSVLVVLGCMGVSTPSVYAAITLESIWAELIQLRAEVASLKSQVQPSTLAKKTVTKKTTVQKGTPASLAKLSKGSINGDIYAIAITNLVGAPKQVIWTVDQQDNLTMVGSLDNSCPVTTTTNNLAMDKGGNLYLNRSNSGIIFKLIYDSNTEKFSCQNMGAAQPFGEITQFWGSAIMDIVGTTQFVHGYNETLGGQSHVATSALADLQNWSVKDLPTINMFGDIVQVTDTAAIATDALSINGNIFLTRMNLPNFDGYTAIGSLDSKGMRGLAMRKLSDDTIALYAFNYNGKVYKVILNADATQIISTTLIADLGYYVGFGDAASAPITSAPLPDLITSDLTFFACCPPTSSPRWLADTDKIETIMTVSTQNIGTTPVTLPVGYHIGIYKDSVGGSTKLSSYTLTAPVVLPPGGVYVKQIDTILPTSMFPSPGTYTIVAKTDTWEGVVPAPGVNSVNESNENNNIFAKDITLIP